MRWLLPSTSVVAVPHPFKPKLDSITLTIMSPRARNLLAESRFRETNKMAGSTMIQINKMTSLERLMYDFMNENLVDKIFCTQYLIRYNKIGQHCNDLRTDSSPLLFFAGLRTNQSNSVQRYSPLVTWRKDLYTNRSSGNRTNGSTCNRPTLRHSAALAVPFSENVRHSANHRDRDGWTSLLTAHHAGSGRIDRRTFLAGRDIGR
ncbi:unnamed protein product [Nesidiocoris tenuis]|uniref:Uncharacterized protein n=1 Tax=Nesidiocoris tenuis TaxID=355587 RepID=A0A6H5H4Z9_9HEMI|nr:unnamed protein product [Nesidiocoris tenuis]